MDNYCSYCFSPWSNNNGVCGSTNCDTGCSTCTFFSNCLSCYSNYTLTSNHSCVLCQIPYCNLCVTQNTCSNCPNSFVLKNNKCQCNSTFVVINDTCQCPSGYIVYNGFCVLCNIVGCSYCIHANVCAQCSSLYNATSFGTCILCNVTNCNQCSNNNYCASCSNNLVVNSNGNACITCNQPSCSVCSSSDYCASCINGLNLQYGTCVSCAIPNCLYCN
jgi:hypothetical protein